MSKFRIYSEPSDLGRRTRLAILIEGPDGRESIAGPMTFTAVDEGTYVDPEMTIDRVILPDGSRKLDGRALLQAMLDHAWEIGMRPIGQGDAADTTKQVAAISAHLEDMRALVFAGVKLGSDRS